MEQPRPPPGGEHCSFVSSNSLTKTIIPRGLITCLNTVMILNLIQFELVSQLQKNIQVQLAYRITITLNFQNFTVRATQIVSCLGLI